MQTLLMLTVLVILGPLVALGFVAMASLYFEDEIETRIGRL